VEGQVTNRERVWWLYFQGVGCRKIAARLDISPTRVLQIIQASIPTKLPGVQKPVQIAKVKCLHGSRRVFSQDQVPDIKRILRRRRSWTWPEASSELADNGHDLPGPRVSEMLRASGFVYDRGARRWTRTGFAPGRSS
jgi:transposase